MAIKHLTPQSKWKILFYRIKDKIIVFLKWIKYVIRRKIFRRKGDFFFPIAQQIAARTIGFDLVNVKPMSGPTGVISYLDYRYGPPIDPSIYVRWPEPDFPLTQENIL